MSNTLKFSEISKIVFFQIYPSQLMEIFECVLYFLINTDIICFSKTFFGAFCFDQQMLHMLLRSGISIRIRATNFFKEISSML